MLPAMTINTIVQELAFVSHWLRAVGPDPQATTHFPLLKNSCIHPGPDYCYDHRVFKQI